MTVECESIRSFDSFFVGGAWRAPSSEAVISVVSPVTERRIATVPDGQAADIDTAVAAARAAFDDGGWADLAPQERLTYLRRLRDEVAQRLPAMESAFTAEIGAPSAVSESFMGMATLVLDDAIELGEKFAFEETRPGSVGSKVRVIHEPVGVVAAIIPWNGPPIGALLKCAPALVAGCTVVLKPSPECPMSVMILAEAFDAAGFPPGVINIVPGGREAGEHLVRHPGIDKVAFTGSTVAGKRIMELCSSTVRNVTLELGGKSAAVIADDIPLEDVLPTLLGASFGHSGQVCAALTRVLVPRARQDELVAALRESLATWRCGDPADPGTALGPLVSESQRDRVEEYIQIGKDEGARLVIGGGKPTDVETGWFVEPTVFADVSNSMRIAREEIFGPVVVLIPFDEIDEAVEIANDSEFGLSGAVFAADLALAERIARRIRTGQISVNSWSMCLSQPFGGYKQSGVGREGGVEGLLPYLETKVLQGL